jgi:hypothetical protein
MYFLSCTLGIYRIFQVNARRNGVFLGNVKRTDEFLRIDGYDWRTGIEAFYTID